MDPLEQILQAKDLDDLPQELRELAVELADSMGVWCPVDGPQLAALQSSADVLFYGGAAGGGKTDLLIGLSLTEHTQSIIFRREGTQLFGILERLGQILGTREGYNGRDNAWRYDNRTIEFGSCPHPGDEIRYQGRPHDFIGFDEITHFMEHQFRFLMGWLRSVNPNQRKRVVAAGNPPTDSDGEWVIQYWGPWLDSQHSNPAMPGELRWFVTDAMGHDQEVPNADPIEVDGLPVTPLSRTFIPSSVGDNPFLAQTSYRQVLASLPEPLRSQMLLGDFQAGISDDPWQVIPTDWVRAAQERHRERPVVTKDTQASLGVDCARGGNDAMVIAERNGQYRFDLHPEIPGRDVPDGPTAVGHIARVLRNPCPVHIDVIGIGSSVYDHAKPICQAVAVSNAERTTAMTHEGTLSFANVRAETYWRMRELLDPRHGLPVELPPDPELRSQLCAPRYKVTASGILVESKDDIRKRLGRSTDKADAIVLANIESPLADLTVTPKRAPEVNRSVGRIGRPGSRRQRSRRR